MAGSRKKLVTEYKVLLCEKSQKIRDKESAIHKLVTDISKETLTDAAELLQESDKKLFLKNYQEVSHKLEACLNSLLLVSSGLPSNNTDSSDSSSSSDSDDEDDDETDQSHQKTSTARNKLPESDTQHNQQKSSPPKKNEQQKTTSNKNGVDRSQGISHRNREKTLRKDQPLYQSPSSQRADSFLNRAKDDTCERDFQPRRINRSLSLEYFDSDTKNSDTSRSRPHPRHSSSPGRLTNIHCTSPAADRTSNWARQHFENGSPVFRSPDSRQGRSQASMHQSPPARHRSYPSSRYPPRRRSPPRQRSPPRRGSPPRRRSPPSRHRSPPHGSRSLPRGRRSPPSRHDSPSPKRRSPPARQESLPHERRSPPARRISPSPRRGSPPSENRSPPTRRRSPPSSRKSPQSRTVRTPPEKWSKQRENKSSISVSVHVDRRPSRSPLNSPNDKPSTRHQQGRGKSPSPKRQSEKYTNESAPMRNRSNFDHHGKRIPPRFQSRNDRHVDKPWYACSSPLRSGDLVKDNQETKQRDKMELSSRPLIIPTEDLKNLVRELGTPTGTPASKSQIDKAVDKTDNNEKAATKEIKQVSVGNSGDNNRSNRIHKAGIDNEGQKTKVQQDTSSKCAPPDTQPKVIKKPPGLAVPSEISLDDSPIVVLSKAGNTTVKDIQRQVKSSVSGKIQVTVPGTTDNKSTKGDVESQQMVKLRELPGLGMLTQVSGIGDQQAAVHRAVHIPSEAHQQPSQVPLDVVQQAPSPNQPTSKPLASPPVKELSQILTSQTTPAQKPPSLTPPSQAPQSRTPTSQTPLAQTPPAQTPPYQTPPPQIATPQITPPKSQAPPSKAPPPQIPPPESQGPPSQIPPSHQNQINQEEMPSQSLPKTVPAVPAQVAKPPPQQTPDPLPKMLPMVLTSGSEVNVVVSEIETPGVFYIQIAREKSPLEQLMMEISEYNMKVEPIPIKAPKPGNVCLAQFSQDNCWYRAGILDVAPAIGQGLSTGTTINLSVGVIFFDYGNREHVLLDNIRVLAPRFQVLPVQAIKSSLSNVKPPRGNSIWSKEAKDLFGSMVSWKAVKAKISVTPVTHGKWHSVDLYTKITREGAAGEVEVNVADILVEKGLAEYVVPPTQTPPATAKQQPKSRSSSESATSRPHTPTDKLRSSKGSSKNVAKATAGGISQSVTSSKPPPGFTAITADQQSDKHSPREVVADERVVSVKQKSVSNVSQDWRVQKASSTSRSQSPSTGVDKPPSSGKSVNAKPGLTLAQTIALQASESFNDDARSTCSSMSMKTARGTSSSTSMHTASEGNATTAKRGGNCTRGRRARANRGSRNRNNSQGSQGRGSQDGRHDVPTEQNSGVTSNKTENLPPLEQTTDQNDSLLLAMSHIVNPSEFYVHPITRHIRRLDFMQEELRAHCEQFCKDDRFSGFVPHVGMVCTAKYVVDDMWYRVKVLALKETTVPPETSRSRITPNISQLLMAQVHFVDFGNTEWTPAADLRPLNKVFFDLPAQAMRCSLAHLTPQDEKALPNYTIVDLGTDSVPNSVPSTHPPNQNEDKEKSNELYCQVCCCQLRNQKEMNDHGNSKDHLLAAKMAMFCKPAEDVDKKSDTDKDLQDNNRGGWSQMAIDIFKELAPCENHSLLGWMVKQQKSATDDDSDKTQLILSYHEEGMEVCINQELVNLGLAKSTRFERKIMQVCLRMLPRSNSKRGLTYALQAWNQEDTGYGSSIVFPTALYDTSTKPRSQIPFILTAPPKKETETVTDRQLNMAMNTWEIKNQGFGAGDGVTKESGSASEEDGSNAQAAAMESWDPKTSDYFSERNSYEVDDEDATAAVGYSHTLDRKFCRFYMRGQQCYRGDQCPYEHPEPGDNLRDKIPVFFAPTNHSPDLPARDDWVVVEVTSIRTPFHFWVQLTWGKTPLEIIQGMGRMGQHQEEEDADENLHSLEKTINECCKINSRSEDPNILKAIGEVVIAKFSRNKRWYRARIIGYDEMEPCLKVFYVDYGNSEWVSKSDVRSPKPEFMHLPFQAVECFLWGVNPVKGKEDATRHSFEQLVMDKALVAHIISSSQSTNTMDIQLYNTSGKQDVSVNQYLIQRGFAEPIPDQMTDKSVSIATRATSEQGFRRNSEVDVGDSISCHEMQIPG